MDSVTSSFPSPGGHTSPGGQVFNLDIGTPRARISISHSTFSSWQIFVGQDWIILIIRNSSLNG